MERETHIISVLFGFVWSQRLWISQPAGRRISPGGELLSEPRQKYLRICSASHKRHKGVIKTSRRFIVWASDTGSFLTRECRHRWQTDISREQTQRGSTEVEGRFFYFFFCRYTSRCPTKSLPLRFKTLFFPLRAETLVSLEVKHCDKSP